MSDAAVDALVGTDKHVTDALGDAAIDFIGRHKEQPFFTFISEFAVHSPTGNVQARRDLLAKYQAKPARHQPGRSRPTPRSPRVSTSRWPAASTTSRQPLTRATPATIWPTTRWSSSPPTTGAVRTSAAYNGPLKGQKGELDEGGVRVPWIAWSQNPDLVRGGTTNSSVINGTDLYPTLAGLAGADQPAGVPFDGVRPARRYTPPAHG